MLNEETLHKWLNNELSESERQAFEDSEDFLELSKIRSEVENWQTPEFDQEIILKKILAHKKTDVEQVKAQAKRVDLLKRRRLMNWMAAACFLLLAAIFAWPNSSPDLYQSSNGELVEATLPDNSKMVLNASSQIKLNAKSFESDRILELEGEAYFDVRKAGDFTVKTKFGQVEVLGTSFNVKARDNIIEVSCNEGKVNVSSIWNDESYILSQGQAIKISLDTTLLWKEESLDFGRWRRGITVFKESNVEEIIAELERQFDVKIITRNIDLTEVLSGNFTHDDLDKAILTSLSPAGIRIESREGNELILTK